jgi:predicted  nucleic acid-binding Zn-ribbon protein
MSEKFSSVQLRLQKICNKRYKYEADAEVARELLSLLYDQFAASECSVEKLNSEITELKEEIQSLKQKLDDCSKQSPDLVSRLYA